jgi:hypothetical protein
VKEMGLLWEDAEDEAEIPIILEEARETTSP